jgi:large subunit ribosomal protein L24
MKKFHIKKNDQVKVITGENKGSEGKVLEVHTKTSRALVEGINMIKRHTKPNTQFPDGGIIEKEAPIHISNLKLVEAGVTAKKSTK